MVAEGSTTVRSRVPSHKGVVLRHADVDSQSHFRCAVPSTSGVRWWAGCSPRPVPGWTSASMARPNRGKDRVERRYPRIEVDRSSKGDLEPRKCVELRLEGPLIDRPHRQSIARGVKSDGKRALPVSIELCAAPQSRMYALGWLSAVAALTPGGLLPSAAHRITFPARSLPRSASGRLGHIGP